MRVHIENLLISLFILSVITTHVYMDYLALPFCVIEVGLIPLVFILKRKYKILSENDFLIIVMIILFLSALSILFLSFEQLTTIWKVIRSYLLFFIAFFFFYRNNNINWNRIYEISCISIVLDIYSSLIFLNQYVNDNDKEFASLINILLPLYVIGYSYLKKGRLQFILVSILCLLDAFCSITRGNMLYVIITILLAITILDVGKSIKSLLFMVILGIAAVNTYLAFEDTIEEYSPSMHYRLYTKITNREMANQDGDDKRKGHLMYLIDHFDYCVIPHGLPSRESSLVSYEKQRLMWSVRDCSLNELIYTYGIFGYFVPLMLVVYAVRLYKKKRDDNMNKVFCVCLLVIDAYLFTGYGLLSTPSTVLYLGMIMGSSYRILKKNSNEANYIAYRNRLSLNTK